MILESKLSEKAAGVYFENPNYLGVIEIDGAKISELAHRVGGESIVGVDPISLGVLASPAEYGADIACGEAQPLGISMYAGGGSCGFIASRDEERYVAEYPLRLAQYLANDRLRASMVSVKPSTIGPATWLVRTPRTGSAQRLFCGA